MLTGPFSYDVKYKNIFSLKKDKHEGGFLIFLFVLIYSLPTIVYVININRILLLIFMKVHGLH